jgi:Family of unknown function (DUF6953)
MKFWYPRRATTPMERSEGITDLDVAKWMAERVKEHGELHQADVVYEIEERFGSQFVYENENGNQAISRDVLQAFKELTEHDVVWCRGDRYWREREAGDEPGRQQP